MEIKPRLFYQVVKIQGRPRPLKDSPYSIKGLESVSADMDVHMPLIKRPMG